MGNSETMSLGVKIGIVVGSLFVVAIVAGIIKCSLNKRRTKKKTEVRNEQRAMQMNSKEHLVSKKLEEGDTSSLERGHFRGTTQSRSNSPTSYILSPATTVVNWGDSKSIHSASSSVIDIPRSRDGSVISFTTMPKKPSPLRLNPSDVPLNSRMSTASSFGGSYIPPLPPPRSARRLANPQASSSWVSPLDVHFIRPTTPPRVSSRPRSYLPELQFPEPAKNPLLVPKRVDSVGAVARSEAASIITDNIATAPEAQTQYENQHQKSPTFNFNFFGSEVPTRPSRKSARSIFPATEDDHRPISYRSVKSLNETFVPIPNVSQGLFGSRSPGIDRSKYSENVVIRDSMVSKRSVSIYQPTTPHTPTEPTTSHSRKLSRVASSIYSTVPSLMETSISRPASPPPPISRARSRSRSTSSKRAVSTQALSRTQDSVRRQSRKLSINENRRSRERDQMHYDPTSHYRNRSGSVQGRNVDFDHPRESPFSNTKKTTHSASSSVSTISSTGIPWQKASEPALEPQLPGPPPNPIALKVGNIPDGDRLSVATAASKRGRSTSEASSLGFSEFYDAYYRQSGLAQRMSQTSQLNNSGSLHNISGHTRASGISQDLHLLGVGVAATSSAKRPPPFRFGAPVGETIIEVASPLPSPAVGMAGSFEGFGNRL